MNALARNSYRPDFTEADDEELRIDRAADWGKIALRNRLEQKAVKKRFKLKKPTWGDWGQLALAVPGHFVDMAVQSAISGATLPADVAAGKMVQPIKKWYDVPRTYKVDGQEIVVPAGQVMDWERPPVYLEPDPTTVQTKEMIGRTLDLAGLASSATLAVPVKEAQLGAGAMRRPKKLYHFSSPKNVEAIRKEGLRAVPDYIFGEEDTRPGVNMVSDKGLDLPPVGKDAVRLEIDPSRLDPDLWESYGSGWHRYLGDIPPEAIVGPKSKQVVSEVQAARELTEAGAPEYLKDEVVQKPFKPGYKAVLINDKVYTDPGEHVNALEKAARDAGYEGLDDAADKNPRVWESLDENNFGEINDAGQFVPDAQSKISHAPGTGSVTYEDYLGERSAAKAMEDDVDEGDLLYSNPKESAPVAAIVAQREKPRWGEAALQFRDQLYTHDFHKGAIDKFLELNGYKKMAEGGLDDAVRDFPDLLGDENQLGGIGKDGNFIPFSDDSLGRIPRRTGGFFANKSPEAGAVFLMAHRSEEPFYSAVERAVDNAKIKTGTGDQWLATLRNTPGIKDEELQWLGIENVLKDRLGANQPRQWTAEQVKQEIIRNRVVLEEHWKQGGGVADKAELEAEINYQMDEWADGFAEDFDHDPTQADIDAAYQDIRENILTNPEDYDLRRSGKATRYDEYQLPGGDNYRELVLTLPQKTGGYRLEPVNLAGGRQGFRVVDNAGEFFGGVFEDRAKAEKLLLQANSGQYKTTDYRSSHWDEPNPIAHVRMNDRYLPVEKRPKSDIKEDIDRVRENLVAREMKDFGRVIDTDKAWREYPDLAKQHEALWKEYNSPEQSKTLFLEELQSDWHQAGRKQGYQDDEFHSLKAKKREIMRRRYELWGKAEGEAAKQGITDNQGFAQWVGTEKNPYWQEILASNAELDALPEGLTDVSSRVSDAPFKRSWPELLLKRMVREAAENGYDQIAWTDGVTQAERYDLSKHIDQLSYFPNEQYLEARKGGVSVFEKKGIRPEQLDEYIGKEAAEKLRKVNPVETKDKDGEIGQAHILSGLDLRVGGEGMRGFYDEMLPRIANKAFGKLGGKVETQKLSTMGGEIIEGKGADQGKWLVRYEDENGTNDWREYNTREEAEKALQGPAIHVLRITPQMKEQALRQGFPLFSSGAPVPIPDASVEPYQRDKRDDTVRLTPVQGNPFQ